MKFITILLLGMTFFFNDSKLEPNTNDLAAFDVVEKRTEYNGIYYSYAIKNTGNTTIPRNSYKVFFKVDGKIVSFDKDTSDIKPGQIIVYESQKTFYQKNKDTLTYSLEISYTDANLENNVLQGRSMF